MRVSRASVCLLRKSGALWCRRTESGCHARSDELARATSDGNERNARTVQVGSRQRRGEEARERKEATKSAHCRPRDDEEQAEELPAHSEETLRERSRTGASRRLVFRLVRGELQRKTTKAHAAGEGTFDSSSELEARMRKGQGGGGQLPRHPLRSSSRWKRHDLEVPVDSKGGTHQGRTARARLRLRAHRRLERALHRVDISPKRGA